MPLFGKPDVRKLEQKRDIKGLIKALKHKNKGLRDEATEALVRIGEEAIEPLINELRKLLPVGPTVKCSWIAVVLGRMGEAAIDPLTAAIREEHLGLRVNAAWALGFIGEPAVQPLIKMLSDPDGNVRGLAGVALARIGGPAVEPLTRALTDANYEVRVDAARALGFIRDRRAIEPLRRALNNGNRLVRLHSAGALAMIDPSEIQAIQLLKEAAQDYGSDSSEDYRNVAAFYLKQIPSA